MYLAWSAFVPFSLCGQMMEKEGTTRVHGRQPGSIKLIITFSYDKRGIFIV